MAISSRIKHGYYALNILSAILSGGMSRHTIPLIDKQQLATGFTITMKSF
jgi:hypothetical protein